MAVLPPSLAYILTLQRGLWENQTSLILRLRLFFICHIHDYIESI